MEPQNPKRFDFLYRRFPLAWIIVWMLIEGIIFHMNYTFRGDEATLHSFEFAATIISIILAVVAIVYTFFQTQQQQTSADNLSAQVHSLREIVPKVVEGVDKLTPLADRLTALHESVGATRKGVDLVGEMLQAFMKAREGSPERPQQGAAHSKVAAGGPQLFSNLLDTGTPYFPLVTYVLLQLSRKGYDVDAILAVTKDAFTKTMQPRFYQSAPEYHNGMWGGMVALTAGLFLSNGVIESDVSSSPPRFKFFPEYEKIALEKLSYMTTVWAAQNHWLYFAEVVKVVDAAPIVSRPLHEKNQSS